jgi:purine-cytosine permease-like protein
MKIVLNILGILIYFLNRYNNRRSKDKSFSINFWVKDNWPELLIVLLVDISIMLLLILNDISIDAAQFLPTWLVKIGDLGIAWLIGLGLASLIYSIFRKKVSDANDKVEP